MLGAQVVEDLREQEAAAAPAGAEGTVVKMPALGESVTEGTVTRWLKEVGDTVEVDEPLVEVSTDKVDTEIPSPASGVLARIVVGEDETAFGGRREPRYELFLFPICPDPDTLVADRAWARGLWDALRPLSRSIGGYVNSMSGDVEEERVLAAYGREKLDRLAQIKAVYDPGNVFRNNVNIKPV